MMEEVLETPSPPEGYYFSHIFRYPNVLTYIAPLLYFFACFAFYVIWNFVRHSFFQGIAGLAVFLVVILSLPLADILRALIQRGVGRLLGYNISFNIIHMIFQPETYTAEPGQFQRRGHVLMIAVVPLSLFILLLLLLILFAGLQGDIGDIFAVFLFVGIARTAGDLYLIWHFLRMSKGTLLYNVNSKEKLIFKRL